MKFTTSIKFLVLIVGILFLFTSVSASLRIDLKAHQKTTTFDDVSFDMLIFISPQYDKDSEMLSAIDSYIIAVNQDLGWNTKSISLTSEMNDYKNIDGIIEEYYEHNPIKACIMVGEDLDTALRCDTDYEENPSTIPWYTIGGEGVYQELEEGISQKPYEMEICISRLYPTSDLDYQTKKFQITSAFQKFAGERQIKYNGDLQVYIDSELA